MSLTSSSRRASWQRYHAATRSGTYGFLSALPLLVLYEVMITMANAGKAEQVRIGAEIWLKHVLFWVGGTGLWVLTGAVVLIGAGILYAERNENIPVRSRYFAGLVAESAVYAVVVALLVSNLVAAVFAAAPSPQAADGLGMQLALSIGAGLYEELLFRVLLVGGLFLALRRLTEHPATAYVVAAVAGALLFSAVHYVGALGDPFALDSFTFRFLFGIALNVLFLLRGFGVAAWTHALYDVWLTIGLFG